ncbi:MAG: hypothetical protein CL678_02970 [Bdellovibrionaceae bacterium]|nr:hypothetical protein [Pseudobdellovibrionaceae bacterium]|tara:strand:- start:1099 stop:2175 length:1077 start_codon:yes stop_codon:yes gene_type:complete
MHEKSKPVPFVGGVFGVEPAVVSSSKTSPVWEREFSIFSASARSSIFTLFSYFALIDKKVWLPRYVCSEVRYAAKKSQVRTDFYSVNKNLELEDSLFEQKLDAGDVVFLVDYFGLGISLNLIQSLKSRGAVIVRDLAQNFYFGLNQESFNEDFLIYSPRKFFGIPDGGILVSFMEEVNSFLRKVDYLENTEASDLMLKAQRGRTAFDTDGNQSDWFSLFKQAEERVPCGHFQISQYSLDLLRKSKGFPAYATDRIRNFNILNDILGEWAIPIKLGEEINGPLGVPILVQNRNFVCNELYKKNIYPAIHWKIDDKNHDLSHIELFLSEHIMTIPCDHRLDSDGARWLGTQVYSALQGEK